TRIVWSCRHVPPLSGLLPAVTGIPWIGLPPASANRCDDSPVESFHLHMVKGRLVAHVVAFELAQHGYGVSSVEDQEVVEEFAADRADEAFGDRVRPWCTHRRRDDLDVDGCEHGVEGGSELGVAVADQEPEAP